MINWTQFPGWVSEVVSYAYEKKCSEFLIIDRELKRLRRELDYAGGVADRNIATMLRQNNEIDRLRQRVAELEDERSIFARTLDKRDNEIAELLANADKDAHLLSTAEQRVAELESYLIEVKQAAGRCENENDRLRIIVEKRGLPIDVFNDCERLTAENKKLRKDAERYLWGLEHPSLMANFFIKWKTNHEHYNHKNPGVHPNEAIDAAMEAEK